MMGFVAAIRLRPQAWNAIGRSGNALAAKAPRQMEKLADIAIAFSEGKRPKAGKLLPAATK